MLYFSGRCPAAVPGAGLPAGRTARPRRAEEGGRGLCRVPAWCGSGGAPRVLWRRWAAPAAFVVAGEGGFPGGVPAGMQGRSAGPRRWV